MINELQVNLDDMFIPKIYSRQVSSVSSAVKLFTLVQFLTTVVTINLFDDSHEGQITLLTSDGSNENEDVDNNINNNNIKR